MVAAEPLGAFNRDPNDLVLTVGGKLVVNHLLEHDFSHNTCRVCTDDPENKLPMHSLCPTRE